MCRIIYSLCTHAGSLCVYMIERHYVCDIVYIGLCVCVFVAVSGDICCVVG